MRNRQFTIFAALVLGVLLLGVFRAGAQPQSAQDKKPAPAKAEQDDGPVAVTPRVNRDKPPEVRPLGKDEFGNFRYPVINNKGDVAFVALYIAEGTPNNSGQSVFLRKADGTWQVTREGEKATNLPEPVFGFSLPALNDNGELTFYAGFGKAPGSSTMPAESTPDALGNVDRAPRYGALYLKSAEGLKSLVKLGEEVPAMPSHFSGVANATTNSKGVTAFIGTYSDPDGRGLFLVEGGKLRLVVRSGQRIGNNEEGTFSEHFYPSPINERNEVAFMQRIGDRSAIFVARPTGVELVAIVGKPSPIPGSNFIGFGNRAPSLNNKGEVVFSGFTDGPSAVRALFFKGAGPVQVVAKSGDEIGKTGLIFTDFLSPAMNSRGDIAFIGKLGGRMQGVFLKTAKGIETVALVDEKIPGAKSPMETFNQFTQPSINERGEIVFYGQIRTSEVAIFHRDEKGVLRVLVKRGDKLPK